MNAFTQLNIIIGLLHQYAVDVGITVATLMTTIYSIALMLDNDQSPAARTERWGKFKRVFLGAALVVGASAVISTFTGLGHLL